MRKKKNKDIGGLYKGDDNEEDILNFNSSIVLDGLEEDLEKEANPIPKITGKRPGAKSTIITKSGLGSSTKFTTGKEGEEKV